MGLKFNFFFYLSRQRHQIVGPQITSKILLRLKKYKLCGKLIGRSVFLLSTYLIRGVVMNLIREELLEVDPFLDRAGRKLHEPFKGNPLRVSMNK